MGRTCFEDYKPTLAMVGLQIMYAALSLMGKATLSQGMSPRVLVVYRQGLATLALAPAACFSQRRNGGQVVLGIKSLCLLFLAALLGVTLNQNFYFLGLHLGSTALATAMINLIPAVTFLMATSLGLEKVSLRSTRSMAKIGGTIVCVGGAIIMAVFKGPKLLRVVVLQTSNPSYNIRSTGEEWLLSCLFLFGCCFCWSVWLILQVPLSKSCPDPISLSAWMCFLGFLQSAVVTFFLEPDGRAWKLDGSLQIFYCIYAGVVGSGLSTYLQAWCVSKRGPLFAATFNPLCTVITTTLGVIILHEDFYVGSLGGAILVVAGLYMVLWGKAEDVRSQPNRHPGDHARETTDLEQPLLVDGKKKGSGGEPPQA